MIEVTSTAVATTVTVAGDLDLALRPSFPEATQAVARLRRQLLTVDVCAVPFMDSVGAAFLISLANNVRERSGVAVLRGANDQINGVLDIIGATSLFRVDLEHPSCAPRGRAPDGREA